MARVCFNQRENYVPMVEKKALDRIVRHKDEEIHHLSVECEKWMHLAEFEDHKLHEEEKKVKKYKIEALIGGLGWLLLFTSLALEHLR